MAVPGPLVRAGRALNNGLYRASGGRLMGKVRGMPVLLITIPGRKTGEPHTTPVLYFDDDGKFVVTGSGAGSAQEPQWFKNLRRTDQAEIEIGRRRTPVDVAIASDEERGILWQRLLLRAPFFADYQKKVERQIPMAILTPTPHSGSW
jgi:deazaflavin-dependent oxidoreductase (nitroreductase family)